MQNLLKMNQQQFEILNLIFKYNANERKWRLKIMDNFQISENEVELY